MIIVEFQNNINKLKMENTFQIINLAFNVPLVCYILKSIHKIEKREPFDRETA